MMISSEKNTICPWCSELLNDAVFLKPKDMESLLKGLLKQQKKKGIEINIPQKTIELAKNDNIDEEVIIEIIKYHLNQEYMLEYIPICSDCCKKLNMSDKDISKKKKKNCASWNFSTIDIRKMPNLFMWS